MPSFRILTNDSGDMRAVKTGFSWPAFMLNLIWLIANGLWIGAFLFFVLISGWMLLFAAEVQESPVAASAMAVAAAIALLLFLGFRGNDWLASHLDSREYTHVHTVEAKNFAEALELAAPNRHAV